MGLLQSDNRGTQRIKEWDCYSQIKEATERVKEWNCYSQITEALRELKSGIVTVRLQRH